MTQDRVILVGNGWSALACAGYLAHAHIPFTWLAGTGARLISPLPTLEMGDGAWVLKDLAERWGIDCGEPRTGSFLREYRNKAFREPAWAKPKDLAAREQERVDSLWMPETRFAPIAEIRFGMDLGALEEALRSRIHAAIEEGLDVEWRDDVPLAGVKLDGDRVIAAVLASGEEPPCSRLIYADRWSGLSALEGIPKSLDLMRKREPFGALQATFVTRVPLKAGMDQGFFGALQRESGEQIERHFWGYFDVTGMRSQWTVFLTAEEVEDNHQIAKKLRRIKQALDRMFSGAEWLPEGQADFLSMVQDEQVRFEEAIVYGKGEAPAAPIERSDLTGISFLTDNYGPAAAFQQAGELMKQMSLLELSIPSAAQIGAQVGVAAELPSNKHELS